jgi:thiosulfate/3-mercaptopyruvate sulfurtransferase
MKNTLIWTFSFLVCMPIEAEIGLISVEEAGRLLEHSDPSQRPVVLDIRGGYKDYFKGHLPMAHHINFDTLRGTDAAVPVQYLPDALTRELLLRAGADRERMHLVYATGERLPNDEILSTSMVVYVLEKFGVRNIRILDGGLAQWQAQGNEVVQDYFGNAAGNLAGTVDQTMAADVKTVLSHLQQADALLVDARPLAEFRGEDDVWLRKGHIPGAISFHWARVMEAENTHQFKALEVCRQEFEGAGITQDKDIICYCGTSREGSLLYVLLKHVLGYPRVRLYEGSWKEYVWVENKSLPVETGGEAAGR